MTQDLRSLLKEARTIIRCHARHFAKDWDERTTKALADIPPQRQPLTVEQVEDCFPDGGVTNKHGEVVVSAQWLHDFAAAVQRAAHGIKGEA